MISIKEVKQRVTIFQALRLIGVAISSSFVGKIHCPLRSHHHRGDVVPSCKIYGESNSMHCFVANQSWDVVGLIAEAKDLQPHEAAEWIAKKLNLSQTPIARFVAAAKEVAKKTYARRPDRHTVVIMPFIHRINAIIKSMGNHWDVIGPIMDSAFNKYDQYCINIETSLKWIEEWRPVFKWGLKEQFKFNRWRQT